MARPLKESLDRVAVERLAERLDRSRRPFDRRAFVAAATRGLSRLELKERVRHVAAQLRAHLDPDWEVALAHVLETLGPPLAGTEGVAQGFEDWPLCQLVEDFGVDAPDASLPALHALTQRFTAEFAIRPFLERDPRGTLRVLRRWMRDPSPHVRRLCSEGTRPRLPWGSHLRRFQERPRETRFLLDHLVDDPEAYVRRSVANHLNDVAKDHADHALEVARRWAARPSERRNEVIRHGLRGLVKQGHPGALALLGYGAVRLRVERFRVTPRRLSLGDSLTIELEIASRARREQRLLIDYALHFRRADGSLRPHVFKWTELTLPASGRVQLQRRHPLRAVTTRRHHPGEHAVEILVNGRSEGRQRIRLV